MNVLADDKEIVITVPNECGHDYAAQVSDLERLARRAKEVLAKLGVADVPCDQVVAVKKAAAGEAGEATTVYKGTSVPVGATPAPATAAAAGAAAAATEAGTTVTAAPVTSGEVATPDPKLIAVDFPLDKDLEFYKAACRKDPTNPLACNAFARRNRLADIAAIKEAARLGISLVIPTTAAADDGYHGHFDPSDPGPSDLQKQFEKAKAKLEEEQKQAKAEADAKAAAQAAISAAAAAAAAAAKAKAEAEAAAAKVAADKAAADAAAKAAADAAAAGASAAEQAAAAAKAKADADAAAAAAAAAAQAKAEADAKAAAEAAAAAAAATATSAPATSAPKPQLKVDAGGRIVGWNGMSVYYNGAETPGGGVKCTGACAPFWPIVPAAVAAGPGVTCAIGKVVRPDGNEQATCGGRPMYFFAQDNAPGDNNGDGNNGFKRATP